MRVTSIVNIFDHVYSAEILEKIPKFSETVYENIGGIFSIDEIPSEVSYNTFLICNARIVNPT